MPDEENVAAALPPEAAVGPSDIITIQERDYLLLPLNFTDFAAVQQHFGSLDGLSWFDPDVQGFALYRTLRKTDPTLSLSAALALFPITDITAIGTAYKIVDRVYILSGILKEPAVETAIEESETGTQPKNAPKARATKPRA